MEQLYKIEISDYLEELGKELDISKSDYEAAVKSYQAVGDYLSEDESTLKNYSPKILPQGSFMLGTIVKPIDEDDDIDIDLVCKLERKPDSWTQSDLKRVIGDRLKAKDVYDKMLKRHKNGLDYKDGGRRCWTLKYSDTAGYHMDILPSFADDNLNILLEKSFSYGSDLQVDSLAIRITDRDLDNYHLDPNVENWMKSNPFGYAKWFFDKALIDKNRLITLNESVDPVRVYEREKLPLQRVVQLLKRHRDIMFSSDKYNSENKPISIIITTLASRAYDKSSNLFDAYVNIVSKMRHLIEDRFNFDTGKFEKWVPNPVNMPSVDNKGENFADKWLKNKQKEEYFYLWLDKLESDLEIMKSNIGKGQHILSESISKMYGQNVTARVFSNIANNKKAERKSGNLKMDLSGTLGKMGIKVKDHEFYGNLDDE